MAPSPPSLPSNRVFVVQFRLQPTGAPSPYDGRIEHLGPLPAGGMKLEQTGLLENMGVHAVSFAANHRPDFPGLRPCRVVGADECGCGIPSKWREICLTAGGAGKAYAGGLRDATRTG